MVPGRLSLRMLACQPRNVIRSQAGSPAGPRSPASYVSHTRFRSGTQAVALLASRSWTDKSSSQSCVGARPLEGRNRADTRSELVLVASNGLAPTAGVCHADWVDGADGSFQCRGAKSTIYMACIGCQLASALTASRQALKRRSDMAAAMRPFGGPGGMTPCSGGVNSLGRHDGSH